jgi:uncharacterized phage protein gp47/JayE
MPFERPTLPQLVSQIETDIDSRLPEAGARAPRSVAGVLARTVAGVIHGLHGYLAWMARQVFVDTAEAEFLDDHARIWGIPRRPAVAATGSLVVTGTAGASVPAGAVLQATDGRRYEVAVGGIIAGAGTVEVPIVAQEAAAAYALPAGASLSFVTPLPGVESRGTVAAGGIGGGADQEADHSLRGRILDRIRQPAQGGARHDYVVWAGQVSGVGSRPDGTPAVWVSPGEMGLGTVVVRLLAEGGGIPDAQLVAAVQTHLDQVRPVTAEVIVVAPVPVDARSPGRDRGRNRRLARPERGSRRHDPAVPHPGRHLDRRRGGRSRPHRAGYQRHPCSRRDRRHGLRKLGLTMFNASAYRKALQDLLPTGAAWPRRPLGAVHGAGGSARK